MSGILAALWITLLVWPAGAMAAADLADGTYTADYLILKAENDSVSMANDYWEKPATVTIKDGKAKVRVTINHSLWVTEFKVPGSGGSFVDTKVISVSKKADTRLVEFSADITKPILSKIHVTVKEIDYDHDYTIRFVFDEDSFKLVKGAPAATAKPTALPTEKPTAQPSEKPTVSPTARPATTEKPAQSGDGQPAGQSGSGSGSTTGGKASGEASGPAQPASKAEDGRAATAQPAPAAAAGGGTEPSESPAAGQGNGESGAEGAASSGQDAEAEGAAAAGEAHAAGSEGEAAADADSAANGEAQPADADAEGGEAMPVLAVGEPIGQAAGETAAESGENGLMWWTPIAAALILAAGGFYIWRRRKAR